MTVFRRRDAWWEMDGKAARTRRRQRRVVSTVAFLAAVAATAGAATLWWLEAGVGTFLHAKLGVL